jgi:tetraprenyl-beta-curcumene synthase
LALWSSHSTPRFLDRLFRVVLPLSRQEIGHWTSCARRIPDETLRHEALQSLQHKRFHADGGCVYAASDRVRTAGLVRLIVALQTISDYLDNLCDRASTLNPEDFRQLHHAMRDAVRPEAPLRDYYALRGHPDDGGYLAALVTTCQQEIAQLPGYDAARPHVIWLIERYSELQEHKHVVVEARQSRLEDWSTAFLPEESQLAWWEWCAATGSTLAVFALFTAAAQPLTVKQAGAIFAGYFPWICGLHILLDYLIDLEEDVIENDFNFIQCYPEASDLTARLATFTKESLRHALTMPLDSPLHGHVVKGLLSMYLSDPKATHQPRVRPVRKLVWRFGPKAWLFYGACKLYRVVR